MSIIKGIIMLMLFVISGVASSRGVTTLAERNNVLTEGLAEAITTKFSDYKSLGDLGELIFQQKQTHILHMSKVDFERFLKRSVIELLESNAMFTTLMEKEALGELTDEEARRLLVGGEESSVATKVFGGTYASYSGNDTRDSIQRMWDKSVAKLEEVEEKAAIEDADARRQAIADYFATSQRQTVVDFLTLMQLGEEREQFNGYVAPSVDMQSAVKEMYVDILSYKELESLARALELDDLLLAAETPIDKLVRMGAELREMKEKKIGKLGKALAEFDEKKKVAAQKEADGS